VLLTALSAGMGINGLITSILAIIQNAGKNPRFSVEVYFLILLIIVLLSFISFALIINTHYANKYKRISQNMAPQALPFKWVNIQKSAIYNIFMSALNPILNQYIICVLNYLLLGILPYTVAGFYNSDTLLLWVTVSGMICGAVGRFSTIYLRIFYINLLTVMQSLFWIFLLFMAFYESKQTLPEFTGWLVVICNGIYSLIYGYEDTIIYQQVALFEKHLVEISSRLVGFANQAGAFTGALIGFILVITKAI